MFSTFTQMNIKTFSALFIRALSGLQELVDEQETQNLTLHSAAPRAVLNFLFLVRELVLVIVFNYACIFGRTHVNKYGGHYIKLRRETL